MHCKKFNLSAICLLFILLLLSPDTINCQTIPPDRSALENSEGAGMAAYADRNGYPGPKHILEFQEKLDLNDEQVKQVEAVYEEMAEKARIKGEEIIAAELRLDELFSAKTASEEAVRSLTTQIGWLRGELRSIHMVAHLQASVILTPEQTALYNSLRHGQDKHQH